MPSLVEKLLSKSGLGIGDIDLFVFHQANATMLEALRRRIGCRVIGFGSISPMAATPVSSTISDGSRPRQCGGAAVGRMRVMLVGFGVGYSWAATLMRCG